MLADEGEQLNREFPDFLLVLVFIEEHGVAKALAA
jgi:hypothetical protein